MSDGRARGASSWSSACRWCCSSIWWFASAGSTDFYQPPLSQILGVFPETWFGERLRDDVLPSLRPARGRVRLARSWSASRSACSIGSNRAAARAARAGAGVPPGDPAAGAGADPHAARRHRQHDEDPRHRLRLRLAGPAQHGRGRARRSTRCSPTPAAATGSPALLRLRHLVLRGGQPADRHRRPAGAVDRDHPDGDQRDVRGQQGLGFTIVQFQRGFADPRDVERRPAARPASASLLSLLFRLVERRVLGWYHGLRAAERSSR